MSIMRWAPAALLAVGALFTVGLDVQRAVPLRLPLASSLPAELHGLQGVDRPLSDEERAVVGVSDYLMRTYSHRANSDSVVFSLYVGYYDRQMQGRTIHSPKNCLPGSGWEALASHTETITTTVGDVQVNRYLIRQGQHRALVLYWYQGRGRVEADEYRVKWALLRDAAFRRRTEEALVRIVIPLPHDEPIALALGTRVVQAIVPALERALPS